jgi:hypothetical protein
VYVQATFPYLNTWLGVSMIYNAATFRQEVHARLVWSNDTVCQCIPEIRRCFDTTHHYDEMK